MSIYLSIKSCLIFIRPIAFGALDILKYCALCPIIQAAAARVQYEVTFLTLYPRLPAVYVVRAGSDGCALQLAGVRRRHRGG